MDEPLDMEQEGVGAPAWAAFGDLMAQALPGLDAYEALGDARLFRSQSAAVALPNRSTLNEPMGYA